MPAKVRRGSGRCAYGSLYESGTSRGACTA